MEGESGFTRGVIDELHSCDIERDKIEGQSGVTPSITDELHSLDIQGDQTEGESMVLHKVSLMHLILAISN